MDTIYEAIVNYIANLLPKKHQMTMMFMVDQYKEKVDGIVTMYLDELAEEEQKYLDLQKEYNELQSRASNTEMERNDWKLSFEEQSDRTQEWVKKHGEVQDRCWVLERAMFSIIHGIIDAADEENCRMQTINGEDFLCMRKIPAIKELRKITGMDLKFCKDMVDKYQDQRAGYWDRKEIVVSFDEEK